MKNIKLTDQNFYYNGVIAKPCPYLQSDTWSDWTAHLQNKELCTNKKYDVHLYTDTLCFGDQVDPKNLNCAWIVEPPIVNGENYLYIVQHAEKFKYIFSFIQSLKDKVNNFVFTPIGGCHLRDEDISIFNKTKLVSMIFSDKQWNMFHKMRHTIYNNFKNKEIIDFYGSGTGIPLEFKITGLKDYLFSVVIENSIESDYFTEKLIDCILTGTVPIYFGTKTTSQYFDANGIIYFENEEQLSEILNKLTPDLYISKLESIKNNFETAKKYMFPEQIIQNFVNNNI